MKKTILLLAGLFITCSITAQTQSTVFIIPTNYEGVLSDVTNSAKAEALGKNSITLDGIRTAFENPACIAPGTEKIQVALNYTKGHGTYPKSYYPAGGISYKVTDKLTLGIATHHWIDPESYWNAQIGNQDFDTDKKAQHVYSFIAGYKIGKHLYAGLSGNLLREMEIEGKTTAKNFMVNTGLIYDKAVSLFKSTKVMNQRLRLAASLYNTLLDGEIIQRANETVIQYRDMPTILRLGSAYRFSTPLSLPFAQKGKKLKEQPQELSLTASIQYGNYLKTRKNYTKESEYQTMAGLGLEATALDILSLRLGYFSETRQGPANPLDRYATKDRRKGFTWGLGCNLPFEKWSQQKVPLNLRFDILAKQLPDLLDEKISTRLTPEFTDKKLFLSLGIEISIK